MFVEQENELTTLIYVISKGNKIGCTESVNGEAKVDWFSIIGL